MYMYMYDVAKFDHSTCTVTYSSINSYYYMHMHFVLHVAMSTSLVSILHIIYMVHVVQPLLLLLVSMVMYM